MDKLIATEEEMLNFGNVLSKVVDAPLVIFLNGNLGAGKTTFVRGFVSALGHEGPVKSPTYNIVESYQFDHFVVFHFDFYRIKEVQELEYIGIQDYFSLDAISLIEWPLQANGLLPNPDLEFDFEVKGEERKIKMTAKSEQGKSVLKRLHDEK